MGTRSTVKFYENDNCICSIYQQYYGDLSGVGKELAEFLAKKKMVNGYKMDVENQANGMGCLVAQYIAQFKKSVGGLYISDKDDEQEYNYKVFQTVDGVLIMQAFDVCNDYLYSGKPSVFLIMLENGDFDEE